MKRVEIITNQAIAEDLLESLEAHGVAEHYTIIPHVHGRGKQGTRAATALWPEENCIYLLFIEDQQVQKVRDSVKGIKAKFPNEGTKCFISDLISE